MKSINSSLLFASMLLLPVSFNAGAQKITSATLLKEMVNRDVVASAPSSAYTLKQASSYDRHSVSKDAPGWYANDDWNWFEYVDNSLGRTEYVMMDQEGPGAIVRFWMTFAGKDCGKGTLRIYVDDITVPVVEGSAFDVVSGGAICGAPLSNSVSPLSPYENRGHDLYYPILYSKRCKVTYESENLIPDANNPNRPLSECVYYNIGYRTYAKGTAVQPFSQSDLNANASLIARINAQLTSAGKAPAVKGSKASKFESTINAGENYSVKLSGAKAISALSFRLDAADREQALRSTVMEIIFDGNSTVWCPVGDFFGTGYKDLYTRTWYTEVKDGNFLSLWVMPFKSSCEIVFHNLGAQAVSVADGEVCTKAWKWNSRSMYFGANWTIHSRYNTGDGKGETQPRDVAFTRLQGEGVYVGDAIALYDSDGGWWGEGDEKIYVDGETFPSIFGTGSEDYFGYAWCRPEVFTGHPFIAQPSGEGDLSVGYTSNSRYRSLDRIPFKTQIDFDMEIYHWNQSLITYASTSFWYLKPGGKCVSQRDVEGAQESVIMLRTDLIPNKLEMSIEGENLLPVSTTGGRVSVQNLSDAGWSQNAQMWWVEGRPGDELVVTFDAPCAGTFKMAASLGMARDYSSFEFYLNGKRLASDLDMYSPVIAAKNVDFGKVDLKEGINEVKVKFNAPANGFDQCMMGIDKLYFTK